MKYFSRALSILMLFFCVSKTLADDIRVYVSPEGDDLAEGSLQHPFATIERALSYVREVRSTTPATTLGEMHIILRGGTYRLASTLQLSDADSGTPDSPTIIEAAEGETPIVSGGIELSDWQGAASAPAGLPAVAQGQIWETDLPSGITLFRQLWVNGQKAKRSSTLDDLSLPRLISVNKSMGELTVPRIEQSFTHPERLELTIIQDWTVNMLRVKTLQHSDERSKLTFLNPESEIEFKRPWPILRADETSFSNHMFYLSNAIELLDQPHEWYRDDDSGKLYYWPLAGETTASVQATVPVLETLINIAGTSAIKVHDISFRGISFEHTTWLRPSEKGHIGLQAGQFLYEAYSDSSAPGGNVAWVGRPTSAVSISDARRILFEDCIFQHLGATGIDFVSGTKQMTVRGCAFTDIAGTAILGGYFGDEEFESHMVYNPTDKSPVCDSIVIDNNYIAHIANEDWGCIGIGIGYASNVTISHNELYDTPYSAISLGWGWTKDISCMKNNRIYANHIHNFSNQMRDSGAIYTLSAQPNSSIENNCIEQVGDPLLNPQMWDMRHAQFDLYLDEGSDYFTVRNNWCERGEFSKNQNGSHNSWGTNNSSVSVSIKNAAGLEADYAYVKQRVHPPVMVPADSVGKDNSQKDIIEYVAQNEGFKMGNAIAVDLNNDNRLDIVYGGGESFQVQHGGVRINTGNYSFAATQGLKRLNMNNFSAGDLNGDGYMDIVQAGWDFYGNYNAVLYNNGDGRLTQQQLTTSGSTSPACGIADVNNDGLTDFFFVGNGRSNSFYLQKRDRSFNNPVSRLSLPDGMSNPNIVFADFNNDGNVDICVLSSKTGGVFTRMFYNDGKGKFTEKNVGFTEYGTRGAMAYADVNNDGWLDIAIGGQFAGEQWNATADQGAKIVTVYLNDQKGGFTKKQQFSEYMFDNVTQPVRFCDWDNDGNTDLIVTGWNMTQGNISRTDVFVGDGEGNFSKIEANLPGVSEGAIELADFGNRGVNDILIHGNCNSGYNGFSGDRRIAVLCRNMNGKANTLPTSPTDLTAEVGENGTVTLRWEAAGDAETSTKSLSYNYYLKNLETGLYMTFPNADVETGHRRVSGMGNAWLNTSWTLQGLPEGTYAWSVQTIDAAYAGSPFAPEQTFTITDGGEEVEPEPWGQACSELTAAGWTHVKDLAEVSTADNYFVLVDAGSTDYAMTNVAPSKSDKPAYTELQNPLYVQGQVWIITQSGSSYKLQSYTDKRYFNAGNAGWDDSMSATGTDFTFTLNSGKYDIKASTGYVGPWNNNNSVSITDGKENIAVNKADYMAPGFYIFAMSRSAYEENVGFSAYLEDEGWEKVTSVSELGREAYRYLFLDVSEAGYESGMVMGGTGGRPKYVYAADPHVKPEQTWFIESHETGKYAIRNTIDEKYFFCDGAGWATSATTNIDAAGTDFTFKINGGKWTLSNEVDAANFVGCWSNTPSHPFNGEDIAANKSTGAGKKLFYIYSISDEDYNRQPDEDPDGIKTVVSKPVTDDAIYNLQGVKMNQSKHLPRGIYIRNGKKILY